MYIKNILAMSVLVLISLMTKAQTDTLPQQEPEPWEPPITIQLENFQTITGRGGQTTNNIFIFNRDGLSIVPDPINGSLNTHFLRASSANLATMRFFCTSMDVRSGWEFYNSDRNQSLLYLRQSKGYVGIGTANPQTTLSVNGEMVGAKIRLTQNNWSDFVFDSAYHLLPLSELETFISKNRHLPGIPSAKEVCRNDLDVGQTQADLLQKVEELTLHLIAQDKELQEQQRLLNEQSSILQKRTTQLNTLEKKMAIKKP